MGNSRPDGITEDAAPASDLKAAMAKLAECEAAKAEADAACDAQKKVVERLKIIDKSGPILDNIRVMMADDDGFISALADMAKDELKLVLPVLFGPGKMADALTRARDEVKPELEAMRAKKEARNQSRRDRYKGNKAVDQMSMEPAAGSVQAVTMPPAGMSPGVGLVETTPAPMTPIGMDPVAPSPPSVTPAGTNQGRAISRALLPRQHPSAGQNT